MQDNRTIDGDLTWADNRKDLKKAVKSKMMEFGEGTFQEVMTKLTPFQIDNKKIGRNSPCGCGSGNKYKKCCWLNKNK